MGVRIAIAGTVIGTVAGITIGRIVRWSRVWGVGPGEADKTLPGDDLVAVPTAIETRGLTIGAPPEAVWPWLVQMGYGRAGWYSYDKVDMRGKSEDRILPAWQKIALGDVIPTSPTTGFVVKLVDEGRALALFSDTALVASQGVEAVQAASSDEGDIETVPAGLAATGSILRSAPDEFAASWTFVLEPLDGGRTRLIERFRVRFGEAGPRFRVIGSLMGFGVFVMMHRQMLGIRERAERTAVVSLPLTTTPSNGAGTRAEDGAPEEPGRSRKNGRAVVAAGRTDLVTTPAT
jgi:hypothetical protein